VTISFQVIDATSDDAVWAMGQYFAEIDDRFDQGFDPGDALTSGLAAMGPPGGAFVIARIEEESGEEPGGEVVGCGGVQQIAPGVGEVKRMWVSSTVRGQGLGRRLLQRLEDAASALGHHTVRLDTNSQLPEAVALYRSSGYVEIERYNDNPYPDHFFEKALGPGAAPRP
jgi:GNAT superfamily N-acetyltransferase